MEKKFLEILKEEKVLFFSINEEKIIDESYQKIREWSEENNLILIFENSFYPFEKFYFTFLNTLFCFTKVNSPTPYYIFEVVESTIYPNKEYG
ncbi:MAG: hypothetical protein M0R38_11375 [Bacteroidia bacterium]|nr:hypothetical protein [Bacteroidia bacterium]